MSGRAWRGSSSELVLSKSEIALHLRKSARFFVVVQEVIGQPGSDVLVEQLAPVTCAAQALAMTWRRD